VRCRIGDGSQPPRVHLAHVRKAHAEALVIGSCQGVAPEHVDVIVDHHQRALSEPGVDAAGGIRQYDPLHTQATHHARSKNDSRQVVPFVEVNSAGQRGDALARHGADDETTCVANHVRRRPVWNRRVIGRDGFT
jgi:hypothetical protein